MRVYNIATTTKSAVSIYNATTAYQTNVLEITKKDPRYSVPGFLLTFADGFGLHWIEFSSLGQEVGCDTSSWTPTEFVPANRCLNSAEGHCCLFIRCRGRAVPVPLMYFPAHTVPPEVVEYCLSSLPVIGRASRHTFARHAGIAAPEYHLPATRGHQIICRLQLPAVALPSHCADHNSSGNPGGTKVKQHTKSPFCTSSSQHHGAWRYARRQFRNDCQN